MARRRFGETVARLNSTFPHWICTNYKKFSNNEETMPSLNTQVISGKVGFHIRDGAHNLLLKDWKWFMDFAEVVIK
jgi:hypothetical protein